MRATLYIAIAFLLVALGIRQERSAPASITASEVEKPLDASHAVTIFSTGWRMTLPRYGQRKFYKGFLVDSAAYDNGESGVGLSVIELPAKGGVSEVHHFDMKNHLKDGGRFLQFLEGVEPGSVLIMGSNTGIGLDTKSPDIFNEQISALFVRLGAKSKPESVSVQSFAYICLQTENGFLPIAETFSETKGVSLSYVVPADRETLKTRQPTFLLDNRVPLLLQNLAMKSASFSPAPAQQFGQRAYEHLVATASNSARVSTTWNLGENAYEVGADQPSLFQSKIAMRWNENRDSIGVRFTLRVNGLWVGDRVILREPGDAARWQNWEQHIPTGTAGTQSVTVEVQWLGSGEGTAEVMIAEPVLISGSMRTL